MRTITDLPVRALVTFRRVPNVIVLWAAVIADGFIISPDAVRERKAYQDAPPHCAAKLGAVNKTDIKIADKIIDRFTPQVSKLHCLLLSERGEKEAD